MGRSLRLVVDHQPKEIDVNDDVVITDYTLSKRLWDVCPCAHTMVEAISDAEHGGEQSVRQVLHEATKSMPPTVCDCCGELNEPIDDALLALQDHETAVSTFVDATVLAFEENVSITVCDIDDDEIPSFARAAVCSIIAREIACPPRFADYVRDSVSPDVWQSILDRVLS